MTMNAGIARALRRFVGASAIMIAGMAGLRDRLYVRIELPPADVDRIVVTSTEGQSHEITDRAAVVRIVRLLRSLEDQALRPRDNAPYIPCVRGWNVEFYRGTEDHGRIFMGNTGLLMQGAPIAIRTEDVLDLHRLLRAGEITAPSAEGGCG